MDLDTVADELYGADSVGRRSRRISSASSRSPAARAA